MTKPHACVFCDDSFGGLEPLVCHLVARHRHQTCPLPGRTRPAEFRVYENRGRRVRCLCGQRFTLFLHNVAPGFQDWAVNNYCEIDSFVAHLRREGGLARHWQAVQDAALLNKIADAGKPRSGSDRSG